MRRPIGLLLGVALLTMLAVLGIVAVTRPGAGAVAKGQPVPNVAGTTIDGQSFDLAALRGHPVVINFWGPSCVPCRTEFPLLAAKAKEHAADGLVIVGVLTDDAPDGARAFVAQYGATWPTVIDPGAVLKAAYHVLGRPQSYFVDRAGILRSIQIGEVQDKDFERQYGLISGGS
ncbi:MAG TPA: TlpA disulfide reductase family protein [Candidatus Limnocylindrales bacterium]